MTHYETRRSRSYDEGEDVASLKQIIKDQQRRISNWRPRTSASKWKKCLVLAESDRSASSRRRTRRATPCPRSIRRVADADAGAPRAAAGRRAAARDAAAATSPWSRGVRRAAARHAAAARRRAAADAAGGSAHPPGRRLQDHLGCDELEMNKECVTNLERTVSVTRDEPLTLYVAHDNVPLGEAMRGKNQMYL